MRTDTAQKDCKSHGYSEYQQQSITCTIKSTFTSFLKSVLGTYLPVLAVLACSCAEEPETNQVSILEEVYSTEIQMKVSPTEVPGHIARADIFIFNTDSLGRLDAYLKQEDIEDNKLSVCSRGGRKRILVCCNMSLKEKDIMNISTEADLEKCFCMLEDTKRDTPMLIGSLEAMIPGEQKNMHLRPVASTIELRSVCCNFTGTPYEKETLTDAKVYLTNVNAQFNLTGSSQTARRFINMGMLNMDDVGRFEDPEIIVQNIKEDIGETIMNPDVSLLCFQNHCEAESPGSPFTRLVIEGKIQGETYYWPVSINRIDNGEGITTNTRHVFDITIRRKGSSDPDRDIFIENSGTIMKIEQWTEKEEHLICF